MFWVIYNKIRHMGYLPHREVPAFFVRCSSNFPQIISTYVTSKIKIITIPMNNQRIKRLNRLTTSFSLNIRSQHTKKKEFRVSRTHILQQTQQPTTDLLIRIILAFWFVLVNGYFCTCYAIRNSRIHVHSLMINQPLYSIGLVIW